MKTLQWEFYTISEHTFTADLKFHTEAFLILIGTVCCGATNQHVFVRSKTYKNVITESFEASATYTFISRKVK